MGIVSQHCRKQPEREEHGETGQFGDPYQIYAGDIRVFKYQNIVAPQYIRETMLKGSKTIQVTTEEGG